MKKRLSIIIALSGLFILNSGCDKKTDTLPENRITTIEATTAQPETKTTLGGADGDATRPVLWSNGDEIMVVSDAYSSTTMTKYKTTLSTPSSSASFSATGAPVLEKEVAAFYPAKASVSFGSESFNVALPTYQKYVAGGFDNGYNPAIAFVNSWNSSSKLTFKNCFSVIKLNIKGTGKVLKITVRSKTLQLSGGFTFGIEDGSMDPYGDNVCKKVVLDCGEGVDLTSSGTNFHIVVPGGTYTNDLVVHVETTNNGLMLSESSKTINLEKGKIHEIRMNYTPVPSSSYVEEGVNYGAGTSVQILIGGSLVTRIFAPVNCGYEPKDGLYNGYPYGKLYQWGRKFGQGYSYTPFFDATSPVLSDGNTVSNVVGQDAANYNMFYKRNTYNDNWCSSSDSQIWNLGSESAPIKTIYNPCPVGWRISTFEELDKIRYLPNVWGLNTHGSTNDLTGRTISDSIFLPATGKLDHLGYAQNRTFSGLYYTSKHGLSPGFYISQSSSYTISFAPVQAYAIRCVKI